MASERIQRQIDRFLDEAEEAVAQGDWSVVSDRANKVLALDPDNADARTYTAAAHRAQDAPGDGVAPPSGPAPASPTDGPTAGHPTTRRPDEIGGRTSFANGRYQVERLLGEGGKKRVYLAHDTLLDREVAFALIKTDGLDETSRTRIQREAQAMGRMGSHPHIVTVFDLGEETVSEDGPGESQTRPYMVTELMGGGDVEGLIENAPDHRLPLEQAIKIAQETCRGLEFAHARGIVHRDLKPGNIWLTEEGTAKIGDFGLAVALDRSRLTREGMMVGTVFYMPPEQAMGGEVTPRSDLYSLGAMLYEMVTGRPPFLGDDSVAIIGQHINTPPVAPTWHNPRCPRPLDALILRLLAKDPAERPASASDVITALEAVSLADSDPGTGQRVSVQEDAHSLDSLAGGVFVGRHAEMGELKAALEDALSGRGRLVTLVGEPGIGKTRTALELATYAGLRQAQVLWGRCYEEQGMPPYWPWVQAIRSYVRDHDPEQIRAEMGAGAAEIAEVVSDVRERLPDLPTAPVLDNPEQARFRLFDSITAFLRTASRTQPLVLVLDDLHWADQPSLLLLQFVARELGGARLLIIGTYRDMELSRQHPLAEALGELTRERLFQRVVLRGLSQEDVGRFIEMTSGNQAPRGLVEAVHSQTEGNPLFVTEIVRLLVQEGELSAEKVRETDSWTIRIPEGVREVIGRRLNRLSQRCNEALTVASVLGREFTMAQLRPLVEEVTEDRLFEILEEALAARVIEELPQSVGRYQFTHALIQETLAEELSLTRRVRLHARIAEALEQLYGDDTESHAAELAHHFAQAEAMTGPEKLVRYSLQAGERALAAYAYEEAQGHF
ncbi:MAG: protein kinase, partial [Chloroflexi bacterium]|nr:protein kinase [Chloroflexota bacterium]